MYPLQHGKNLTYGAHRCIKIQSIMRNFSGRIFLIGICVRAGILLFIHTTENNKGVYLF